MNAPALTCLTALTVLLSTVPARAEDDDADSTPSPQASATAPGTTYRLELKYAATNRGSPGESTRTTLRGEVRPGAGAVAYYRVNVPWVNKNDDFASDPLSAGVGDLALKVSLRAPPALGATLAPSLELVLPTAETSRLGSGKWVVAPALAATWRLPEPWSISGRPMSAGVEPSLRASVAGDADRAEIGYAAVELKLVLPLAADWGLEALVKPVLDWEAGWETAGVAELTGEWTPGPWRLALKLGQRLWGGGVGGTYDERAELTVRRDW